MHGHYAFLNEKCCIQKMSCLELKNFSHSCLELKKISVRFQNFHTKPPFLYIVVHTNTGFSTNQEAKWPSGLRRHFKAVESQLQRYYYVVIFDYKYS